MQRSSTDVVTNVEVSTGSGCRSRDADRGTDLRNAIRGRILVGDQSLQ